MLNNTNLTKHSLAQNGPSTAFSIKLTWCVVSPFSHVRLFTTPWAVLHQASLSMGLSRQEYWCGLPSPPPGDLPDLGIKPASLMSPALAREFFITEPQGKRPPSRLTWEAKPDLPFVIYILYYSISDHPQNS